MTTYLECEAGSMSTTNSSSINILEITAGKIMVAVFSVVLGVAIMIILLLLVIILVCAKRSRAGLGARTNENQEKILMQIVYE